MGAQKRLKEKIEYLYRKGSTNESRNCKWCASFVKGMTVNKGWDHLDIEPRCRLFGLAQSSRYRVREDHTCTAQQSTYRNPFTGKKHGNDQA